MPDVASSFTNAEYWPGLQHLDAVLRKLLVVPTWSLDTISDTSNDGPKSSIKFSPSKAQTGEA